MAGWNLADVFEEVAAAVGERPCQIQGDRVVTWASFDRRANAFAADLYDAGLGQQSKVANYLYNCPEYLETYAGAWKGGFVPLNTNYRYGPDELTYLWGNADAEAIVFHAVFTPTVELLRERMTKVRRWYVVADDTGPGPDWAIGYESVVGPGADRFVAPWGRSGDDLMLLYTGGTTGIPKGVMWPQSALWSVLGGGGHPYAGLPPLGSLGEVGARVRSIEPPPVTVVACPLMHGTGQLVALQTLTLGGAVGTVAGRRFDAGELWREVARLRATTVIIVGQAFAGPMLEWLDAHPGEVDLSSVAMIASSGVMWSHDNKQGLLRAMPQAVLLDALGSSEAVGLGASVSVAGQASETAKFALGPDCAVFTEDGRRVEPGSGEQGMVAMSGAIPLGYYKDEAKTAKTFRTFEGRRWSIPGDWVEIEADGSLKLLGRGSVCINTGGEKVFPEEVEEALKTHPAVRDAVVVGVPDARFWERICVVIEPHGSAVPTLAELDAHVRARLADYKVPRALVVVETIGRAVNGKVDYARLKDVARSAAAG